MTGRFLIPLKFADENKNNLELVDKIIEKQGSKRVSITVRQAFF